MKLSKAGYPKVLWDIVAFKWLKDKQPCKIEGFQLDEGRYDSNMDRMGNIYTCEVIATGPKVSKVKPGDLIIIHEYDKINQGEGWDDQELLFCREDRILCIPDEVTEVTNRERELTAEEEQQVVDEF
jgi:hypothetical protein